MKPIPTITRHLATLENMDNHELLRYANPCTSLEIVLAARLAKLLDLLSQKTVYSYRATGEEKPDVQGVFI